jgi:phage-related protein
MLVTLATLFCFSLPASAQTSVPQDSQHDQDTTRARYAAFDRFLDSNPEVAEQLRKDPALMKNDEFRENHPALKEFLQQHPGIREEFAENPNAFMRQERRFDRREDGRDGDVMHAQLARMDQFLDGHPEIAEQLRKDPGLMKSDEFTKNHPALQEFLQQHPGIREEFAENPNAFMRQEQRFDRREDGRDGDVTHAQLARMDQFLDSHPEIAEQLRKDPGLMKSDEFAKNHPALQEFLQQHPGIREEVAENPNAFMRQEQRFDRREDGRDLADFGQFLGGHSKMAQELSRDPRLANNQQFIDSHPELQEYLKAHPGVRDQLTQNPRAVMSGIQPLHNNNPSSNGGKTFNLDTKPAPMEKQ